MTILALHQTSRPHELAREINKLTDGIERDSKLAGQHLATLKAGKPLGITWEHYLKDCGVKVSARHADRLIQDFQGPSRKPPKPPAPVVIEPPSDTVSEPPIDPIDENDYPDSPLCHAWKNADADEREDFLDLCREEVVALLKKEETGWLDVYQRQRDAVRRDKAEIEKEITGLRRQLNQYQTESEVGELLTQNAALRRRLEERKSPGQCAWERTDGGRRLAGYGGPAGDCGARAASIATGKPYAEVFEALRAQHAKHIKRSKAAAELHCRRRTEPIEHGCEAAVMRRYMRSLGWEYTKPKERLYLRADMLPKGRLVVLINRHYVAVIDGVIHDTYDSGGEGKRPVEGYWSKRAALDEETQ